MSIIDILLTKDTFSASSSTSDWVEVPSAGVAGRAGAKKRRQLGIGDGDEEVDVEDDVNGKEGDDDDSGDAKIQQTQKEAVQDHKCNLFKPKPAAPAKPAVPKAASSGSDDKIEIVVGTRNFGIMSPGEGAVATVLSIYAYLTEKSQLKFRFHQKNIDKSRVGRRAITIYGSVTSWKQGIFKGSEPATRAHIKQLLLQRIKGGGVKEDDDVDENDNGGDGIAVANSESPAVLSPAQEVGTVTSADALFATLTECWECLRVVIQKLESNNSAKDEKIKKQARKIATQAAELEELRARITQSEASGAAPSPAHALSSPSVAERHQSPE